MLYILVISNEICESIVKLLIEVNTTLEANKQITALNRISYSVVLREVDLTWFFLFSNKMKYQNTIPESINKSPNEGNQIDEA